MAELLLTHGCEDGDCEWMAAGKCSRCGLWLCVPCFDFKHRDNYDCEIPQKEGEA